MHTPRFNIVSGKRRLLKLFVLLVVLLLVGADVALSMPEGLS